MRSDEPGGAVRELDHLRAVHAAMTARGWRTADPDPGALGPVEWTYPLAAGTVDVDQLGDLMGPEAHLWVDDGWRWIVISTGVLSGCEHHRAITRHVLHADQDQLHEALTAVERHADLYDVDDALDCELRGPCAAHL
jgi:hypothetical protein